MVRKPFKSQFPAFAAAWVTSLGLSMIPRTGTSGPMRPGQTHVVTRSPATANPTLGPRNAPITIWMWSSFRLYHMKGLLTRFKILMQQFPGQIRVVGLHRSRGYAIEDTIAYIAREAFVQGGSELYWKVHNAFTRVRQIYRLTPVAAKKLAVKAGVNLPLLEKALKSEDHHDAVYNDTMLLLQLGISPRTYYVPVLINTEMLQLRRYLYMPTVYRKVKYELAKARKAIASGIAPSRLARWALAKAKRKARFRTYRYGHYRYRRYGTPLNMRKLGVGTNGPVRRYHVPVDDTPMRGNPLATVTAVVFIDFRNYYSANAWKELKATLNRLKNRMRLSVRFLPATTDRHALWAARLALAAHRLGKFWQMADEMAKSRYRLYPHYLKQLADKTGVNLKALKVQLESPEVRALVNRDRRLAVKLGVYNAPAVFINGRKITGLNAKYSRFFVDAVIRDELKPGLLTRMLGDSLKKRPALP